MSSCTHGYWNQTHTQSMVVKGDITNRANVHTPMRKSCIKHSRAEFKSIQQFLLQLDIIIQQTQIKIKILTSGEAMCMETRDFSFWLYINLRILHLNLGMPL